MASIRRYALLLIVLVVGVVIGNVSLGTAFIVLTPLLLIWLMAWDDKSYKKSQQKLHLKQEQHYYYKNSH